MSTVKLTPLARADLQWFADHPGVGWFDSASPTRAMRRNLVKKGLIEEVRGRPLEPIRYRITPAGQAILEGTSDGTPRIRSSARG